MRIKILAVMAAIALSAGFTSVSAADNIENVTADLIKAGIVDEADDLRLEDNVSKAEALKMICVMAQIDLSQYSEYENQFPDVTGDHWAVAYINAGNKMGIVNGDENGLFNPEQNVTSAQMQKMLVCALGYSVYADRVGGYPNGYLSYSNSLGINEGILVSPEEDLTREETMVMIYNSLDSPLMEIKWEVMEDGSYAPKYVIYDGQSAELKTFRMGFPELN